MRQFFCGHLKFALTNKSRFQELLQLIFINIGFYLFNNYFPLFFLLSGPPGPQGKRGKKGKKGDNGEAGAAVSSSLIN